MIQIPPEQLRQLEAIQEKPMMSLTADELQVEQALLREKLKNVNKNLDRLVNKQIIAK